MKKKLFFRSLALTCTMALLAQLLPMSAIAQTSSAPTTGFTTQAQESPDEVQEQIQEPEQTQPTTEETFDESPIVGEDVARRDRDEKHFRKKDGTYLQVSYNEPVHYQVNGEWKDIDNTLIKKTDTAGQTYLVNKASDIKVALPASAGKQKEVSITYGNYTLGWTMAGQSAVLSQVKQPAELETSSREQASIKQQKALSRQEEITSENENKIQLKNRHAAVIYAGSLPATDIRYDIQGDGLKESIILNKPSNQKTFTFHLTAPGLTATLEESNAVFFYADDGTQPVFTIAAPYMTDEAQAYSDDIEVHLTKTDEGWDYTITPSQAWLNDSERQYPVVIDPSVSVSHIGGVEEMFTLTNREPNSTGTNTGCVVGSYRAEMDDKAYTYRTFLKTGAYTPTDNTRRVVRARLALSYNFAYGETDGLEVRMYQALSSFNTSTTWNTQPARGELIDYVITDVSDDTTNDRVDYFDFTRMYYAWQNQNSGYPNYGIILSAGNESGSNNRIGYCSLAAAGSAKPRILIDYRDVKGVEDYWTYTSMSSGYGATTMVNNFSGNVVSIHPLISAAGNRMPVSINLIYNTYYSNQTAAKYMGTGWRLNYQMTVKASTVNKDVYPYVFTDGDGTEHYFYYKTSGSSKTIVDEDGLGYTLTVGTSSTDKYTIKDKTGNVMIFNSTGNLRCLKDTNGQQVTITYGTGSYSDRIEKITDGAGRNFVLSYSSNKLSSVKDPDGRTVQLTYPSSTSNYLKSITQPGGHITNFEYITTGSGSALRSVSVPNKSETLISYKNTVAQAPAGWYGDGMPYAIQNITYHRNANGVRDHLDNNDRVKSTADLLERYQFYYTANATTTTDKAGRTTLYQFNNFGQTVGIRDNSSGTAMFYEYGMPGGDNASGTQNKVLTSSKAQASLNNYAKNHGFNGNYNNWTIYSNKSNQTYQATYDSTKGHFGKGSIKIAQQSGNPGLVWCSQDLTDLPSGNVTISSYINTAGQTLSGSQGAVIYIEVVNKSTGAILRTAQSTPVKKTAANEWKRMEVSVSFTAGEKLRIFSGVRDGSVGTFWMDDYQVERGEAVNTYNLLEDGYMKNGWTNWVTSVPNKVTVSSGNSATSNEIGFAGTLYAQRSIYQDVKVNGVKGDVFALGGYGKASSMSLESNDRGIADTKRPTFRLELEFYNGSTKLSAKEPYYIEYNPYCLDWQYVAGRIIAPGTYDRVRLQLRYDYNYNNVRFKSLYLNKEEFGQTYVYDKSGNVTSAKDLSDSQSNFAYQYNELSKMLNPSGSRYVYSYGQTHNLEFALDLDSGLTYYIQYDSYGNPVSAKTTAMKRASSLSAGKTYVVMNAYSGNVVDNKGNAANNDVVNWRFQTISKNQKWTLASGGTTDVYKLRRSDNSALALTASGTSQNSAFKLQTDTGASTQKFKILRNSDGSFRILLASNTALCVDGQPGSSTSTNNNSAIKLYTYSSSDEGQKWFFFEYDGTNTDNKNFMESSATYTSNGNHMASQTDSRGKKISYTYDTDTGLLASMTDPRGTKTSYTYNSNTQELKSVTATASGSSTQLARVNYTYAYGELTNISNGDTNYTLHYDSLKRPTGVTVGNRRLSTISYNIHNMVGRATYGNGAVTTYWHDTLNRMTQLRKQSSSSGAAQDYYYVYNANGLLSLKKDFAQNVRTRYTYDTAGRMIGMRLTDNASQDGGTLKYAETYEYENKTNRIKNFTMDFGGSETYTGSYRYGSATSGQMVDTVYGVTFAGVERVKREFDSLGRRTKSTIYTGSTSVPTTYTYVAGAKSGEATSLLSTISTKGVTWKYEYDDNGNITKIYRNGTLDKEYTYDALGQMTKEVDHTIDYTSEYSYDTNGNITFMSGTGSGRYDTYLYRYEDSQWGDLLTGYDGTDITYDSIGNPLSYYSLHSFEWSNGRELSAYKWNGQVKATYQYNDNGIRTSKTVNGHTNHMLLSGDTIVRENPTGNIWLTYLYDENGQRYGFQYKNGSTTAYYYYIYNGQGDVIGILNSSGSLVAEYAYNAWGQHTAIRDGNGNPVSSSNTTHIANLNPFRYRGYYYDTESYFYYLNSRYYDAKTGRFINADGQINDEILGTNLFAYCSNNPVMLCDPDGHIAFLTACFIVGAVTLAIDWFSGAAQERANTMLNDPSLYNIANWATAGLVDTVKGAVAPEKPLSAEHWIDSAATASLIVGAASKIPVKSGKSAIPSNVGKPASRGSTAKRQPSNLTEQLALEQVKSNPQGSPIPITMADPRWPASEGWVKMQQIVPTSQGNINIHYLYNESLKIYDDFTLN